MPNWLNHLIGKLVALPSPVLYFLSAFRSVTSPVVRSPVVRSPAVPLSRSPVVLLSVVLLLVATSSCKKSTPATEGQAPAIQPSITNHASSVKSQPSTNYHQLLKIHWLGKDRLDTDPNAANLMAIWNLPESARLESQTLDKLSLWLAGEQPAKRETGDRRQETGAGRQESGVTNSELRTTNSSAAGTNSSGTNQLSTINSQPSSPPLSGPAALLRPLLDDLVHHECHLEVRTTGPQTTGQQATNSEVNAVLAIKIKLDPTRSKLWQTNLAELGKQTGDGRRDTAEGVQSSKFKVQSSKFGPWTISSAHSADWQLIELSHGDVSGLIELATQAERGQPPFAPNSTTNFWLEVDADLTGLFAALKLPITNDQLPMTNAPGTNDQTSTINHQTALLPSHLSLSLAGDGTNLLTRAELKFPKPLPFEIEPWNIPTNLIHGPLHSFSAVQGLRGYLSAFTFWKELGASEAPNQMAEWAQEPAPFLTYIATPMPGASNFVYRLSQGPVQAWNRYFAPRSMGEMVWLPDEATIRWTQLALSAPFLASVRDDEREFLLSGFVGSTATNQPIPGSVVRELFSDPKIVAYHRELTGPRTFAWLLIGQTARIVWYKAQLPVDSAANAWVRALWQRLGNSTTYVTKTDAETLSATRESSIGLTSVELHLLADWLESPRFPAGLHTLEVPGLPPPGWYSPSRRQQQLPPK